MLKKERIRQNKNCIKKKGRKKTSEGKQYKKKNERKQVLHRKERNKDGDNKKR